ncbi:MAG TPA: EAL domain-containing protein [Burkholderiales bacterium]|jgi:diguanylate cyclase (GGDEF)-like protein/PAS domain S-box-containing protein
MNEPKPRGLDPATLLEQARASYAGRTRYTQLEYEALLANLSIGIAFTRDRRFFLCNPRFAEMFGWKAEELIGQEGEVVYPSAESYAALGEIAVPILTSGRQLDLEWEMRRKDGTSFVARLIAKAIDPDHTRHGTVWIIEDITERRRQADQIQRLLREQEAILGTAYIGMVFLKDRQIVRCNRRYEEMYGYAPGEMDGMHVSALYASEEADAKAKFAYAKLNLGQTSRRIELCRRKDGSTFWMRADGRAVDPQDPYKGSVWTVEDVTEQRRAEEQLQRVLAEQQALLNNVVVGIKFTRERKTVRCNRRFEEMFGYAPGAAVGSSSRDMYFTDEEYEKVVPVYAEIDLGRTHTREQWLRRQDGSGFWCRISGRAVEPGDPSKGHVWLLEDITQARQAEERVQRVLAKTEQEVAERTAELRAANERAQHLADHDALTGLPNRRLLEDRLTQALALSYRNRKQTAVMFVDLDRFKTINDSLGHSVGDVLLKEVAVRLGKQLREVDTICRTGGDEFVVVLPEIKRSADAANVAQKIIENLSQPVRVDERELTVTPSIGIAVFPEDGRDAETLIRNADAAMYHAKESGRANYQFFTEQMNLSASRRLALENDLRRALARGELRVHYQPIVDAKSGKVSGHEALIRWQHPERGLLPPSEFIQVAEDTGLILKIGEWVLMEACRWATFIGVERNIPVSVNLSARQFNDPKLVQLVARALKETGLPASLLTLEITESTAMQQTDVTLGTLRRLKELGVSIAIDDFGTGYSSFSYLKLFPVNSLKIDRSFISEVERDGDNRAIVAAIIALAQVLGLKVVAEGVETEAQKQFLRGFGCEQVQGYLTGKPVDADSAAKDFL